MEEKKEVYSRPDFRVKDDIKNKLKDYCASKRQSISKYIEDAVSEFCKKVYIDTYLP